MGGGAARARLPMQAVLLAAALAAGGCGDGSSSWQFVGDRRPTALLDAWPLSGPLETVFSFSASASTDDLTPAAELEVRWDFDGDGEFETTWSTDKAEDHAFAAAGTYAVTVEVRDASGRVGSATETVEVLGTGPLTLTAPVGGEQWIAGDTEAITWSSPGSLGDIVIEISRDGGDTWSVIGTVADTGSHPWDVAGPSSADCIVRISPESQPEVCNQSEEAFMVLDTDRSVTLTNISPVTTERWQDIAGNTYSGDFMSTYDYDLASVTVHWCSQAASFMGRVEATGLKPNFAYQVKLCGDRSYLESFEKIGYLGRWWIDIGGTNFTDAQYEEYRDDPGTYIEAYIFFVHFVTDGDGNADLVFSLDSTLHVIWSLELNPGNSPGPEDSQVYPYTFTPSGPAYDAPLPETTQHLWLEHEWVNPRPAIGEAVMAEGEYVGRVVLTEESFHKSGLGGYWATVLSGDVDFIIDR